MTSATRSVRSPAARASHSPSSSPLPWGSAPTSRCSASSTRSCSGRPCTSATSTAWSTSACGPIPTTSICATRRARSAASPGGGLPRARTRSPTVTASCPCNKCSRQHRSFRCSGCNRRSVASTPLPRIARAGRTSRCSVTDCGAVNSPVRETSWDGRCTWPVTYTRSSASHRRGSPAWRSRTSISSCRSPRRNSTPDPLRSRAETIRGCASWRDSHPG